MARKDFEQYYNKIRNQYFQLVDALEEAGKLTAQNLVDPQVLDNLTVTMQPIKNSYMSLAYVEYLLNLPKNKKVQKRNEKQFKSLLEKIDSTKHQEFVIKNNEQTISNIHDIIDKEIK